MADPMGKTLSDRRSGRKAGTTSTSTSTFEAFVKHVTQMDEDLRIYQDSWGAMRKLIARIVCCQAFDCFMGFVILINFFLVIVETDRRALCDDKASNSCSANNADVRVAGMIMLFIYIAELLARLYVYREGFPRKFWNNFDLVIVVASVLSELIGGISVFAMLRIARVLRLVRIFRLLTAFRSLYLIVNGFADTMKTIFWALVLLFLLLTLCSLIAVDFLNDLNTELYDRGVFGDCALCKDNFSSVGNGILTFVQTVIIGDEWGSITIPLMKESVVAAVFFLSVMAVVFLGFSNVIMSVIVEQAAEARETDDSYQIMIRDIEQAALKAKVLELCKDLDENKNGDIEVEELMHKCQNDHKFQQGLRFMEVDVEDLELVWAVMDKDNSGTVTYEEFADAVIKMKYMDTCALLTFIKHHVVKVREAMVVEMAQTNQLVRKILGSEAGGDFTLASQQLNPHQFSKAPPGAFSPSPLSLEGYAEGLKPVVETALRDEEDWQSSTLSMEERENTQCSLPASARSVVLGTSNLEEQFGRLREQVRAQLTQIAQLAVSSAGEHVRGELYQHTAQLLASLAEALPEMLQVDSGSALNSNRGDSAAPKVLSAQKIYASARLQQNCKSNKICDKRKQRGATKVPDAQAVAEKLSAHSCQSSVL